MHKARSEHILLIVLLFLSSYHLKAQRSKADSIIKLIRQEKMDSNKVTYLTQLAGFVDIYNPDTAVYVSQQALYLAKRIKYVEGESQSLGVLANSFIKYGNYPRALKLSLEKLQLEEKRHRPENMASVMISIGVIYVLQKDFENALHYYRAADSLIHAFNIERLKYFTSLNIGDVFNRMNVSDSAHIYFDRSLKIAEQNNNIDFIGTSFTGLGHSFAKLHNIDSSLYCYRNAVSLLKEADDDETYCEAALGLANLFNTVHLADSAQYYAYSSYLTAKGKFPLKELEAVQFISDFYKTEKNTDSAFVYLTRMIALNDSINNNNRIRELQVLSSNEKFRQYELEEATKLAEEERKQRLQLLFIGIFIPAFFLLTLLLSRVRIHVKVIRVLGVLSLLFFFEYITILLHPAIQNITHHTPWMEILLFVSIGAILVPAHHRMEHWVIHKLLGPRVAHTGVVENSSEETEVEVADDIVINEEENLSEIAEELIETNPEPEIKKADL